ncbi:hypothetical protein EVAR_89763_1 [Eumeta japonica]|uniref:Uncharacterized protein n=1 Tax=Eumeta variegata TaxID=151549 RepID=A0A4C1XFS0_EUMVA|nr:hypothetical protein EVAR_89763_1 [Eumeta japonica]
MLYIHTKPTDLVHRMLQGRRQFQTLSFDLELNGLEVGVDSELSEPGGRVSDRVPLAKDKARSGSVLSLALAIARDTVSS